MIAALLHAMTCLTNAARMNQSILHLQLDLANSINTFLAPMNQVISCSSALYYPNLILALRLQTSDDRRKCIPKAQTMQRVTDILW